MNWRAFPSLMCLTVAGFTDGVVNVASEAWRQAAARGHESITPEHLLAAMAAIGYRPTRANLERLGLNFRTDANEIAELAGPISPGVASHRLSFGPETRALLSEARSLARSMHRRYVGTEHVILALLLGPSCPAADFLRERGVSVKTIRAIVAAD